MSDTRSSAHFCPKCGGEVPDGDGQLPKFCPGCGGALGGGPGVGMKVAAFSTLGVGALMVVGALIRGFSGESRDAALLRVDVQAAERSIEKQREDLKSVQVQIASQEAANAAAEKELLKVNADIKSA